ncbi:THAP domain-containing protein 2 [Huso huso]|uniref:THAP domain-containing protein 2 n=1 Tax=Huso huso TaxID=61971 RepID=A0ABR0ZV30_HUSHU
MPTCCAAFGCCNTRKKDCGFSFHRFPLNKERREKWIHCVRRVNFNPSLNTFLCSKHFEESCFDRTGQTVRLREDAVPTIFVLPDCRGKKVKGPQQTTTNSKGEMPVGNSSLAPPVKTIDIYQDHNYCLASLAAAKEKILDLKDHLEAARKKLKVCQQRERRMHVYWREMKDLVLHLERSKLIPPGFASEVIASTLRAMSLKSLKNEMKVLPSSEQLYSYDLRRFCLTLYFYAPDAYKFVGCHLDLPHSNLVREWADVSSETPGFTEEPFQWLSRYSLEGKQFCLQVNGVKIQANTQRDTPFEQDIEADDCVEIESSVATETLVFLLVAVNADLKLPLGYALNKGLSADTVKKLLHHCLSNLTDVGIVVKEVTFDDTSTQIVSSKVPQEQLYSLLFSLMMSQTQKIQL